MFSQKNVINEFTDLNYIFYGIPSSQKNYTYAFRDFLVKSEHKQ